ncbi:hypothetical protein ABVT39_024617 [Epinephelus coioides]
MHEALGARPSISPPVLVSSCLPDLTILPPSPAESSPGPSSPTSPPDPSNSLSLICPSSPAHTPGLSPSSDSPQSPVSKSRRHAREGVLQFLEKESAKEDKRQEDFNKQTERLVLAFEKMVDKM